MTTNNATIPNVIAIARILQIPILLFLNLYNNSNDIPQIAIIAAIDSPPTRKPFQLAEFSPTKVPKQFEIDVIIFSKNRILFLLHSAMKQIPHQIIHIPIAVCAVLQQSFAVVDIFTKL